MSCAACANISINRWVSVFFHRSLQLLKLPVKFLVRVGEVAVDLLKKINKNRPRVHGLLRLPVQSPNFVICLRLAFVSLFRLRSFPSRIFWSSQRSSLLMLSSFFAVSPSEAQSFFSVQNLDYLRYLCWHLHHESPARSLHLPLFPIPCSPTSSLRACSSFDCHLCESTLTDDETCIRYVGIFRSSKCSTKVARAQPSETSTRKNPPRTNCAVSFAHVDLSSQSFIITPGGQKTAAPRQIPIQPNTANTCVRSNHRFPQSHSPESTPSQVTQAHPPEHFSSATNQSARLPFLVTQTSDKASRLRPSTRPSLITARNKPTIVVKSRIMFLDRHELAQIKRCADSWIVRLLLHQEKEEFAMWPTLPAVVPFFCCSAHT